MIKNPELKEKVEFLKGEERRHESILKALYKRDYPKAPLVLPAEDFLPELSFVLKSGMTVPLVFKSAMESEKTIVSASSWNSLMTTIGSNAGRWFISDHEANGLL